MIAIVALLVLASLCWLVYRQNRQRGLWRKAMAIKDERIQVLHRLLDEQATLIEDYIKDFVHAAESEAHTTPETK